MSLIRLFLTFVFVLSLIILLSIHVWCVTNDFLNINVCQTLIIVHNINVCCV